jgi:hypothetical protein
VIISHDGTQYRVVRLAAEAAQYRVYVCEDVGTGRQHLLQIATELEFNGGLERAAYVLRELKQASDLFEAEYARHSGNGRLHYDRLFPEVVASFVSDEQGKRRMNILTLTDVEVPTDMVPLSNLRARDKVRIDLESSAWIMGRLLKLLGFTHQLGFAVRVLSGNNVLIDPRCHFAVVFDWSTAYAYQQAVPEKDRKKDIADAARAVFKSIGGNSRTLKYSYDDTHPYVDLLRQFARRREGDADKAHHEFYELVDGLFGRGFRPFKTLPL